MKWKRKRERIQQVIDLKFNRELPRKSDRNSETQKERIRVFQSHHFSGVNLLLNRKDLLSDIP